MGIECRDQNQFVLELIEPLNHVETAACVTAERAVTRYLNGGCHAPIAAYAIFKNAHLFLRGMVASPTSFEYIEDGLSGSDPQLVGTELAKQLIAKGANRILSQC